MQQILIEAKQSVMKVSSRGAKIIHPSEGSTEHETDVARIVHRNIRTMLQLRQQAERRLPPHQRLADQMTRVIGTVRFIIAEMTFIALWLVVNLGLVRGIRPFDPFPFLLLCVITTIESIFLATFVLISQNRMRERDDRRDELDLQINLLTQHEVTRLIDLVDRMANRLGVQDKDGKGLDELKKEVPPEKVLRVIERELEGEDSDRF